MRSFPHPTSTTMTGRCRSRPPRRDLEGGPFVVSSLIMSHRRDGSSRRAAFDFVLPAA